MKDWERKVNMDDVKVKRVMRYRWVVWGVLALAYLIVYFHRLAVGVVREDLVRDFAVSASTFANLGSAYFYAYLLMQIPSGMLADSLGARMTVTLGILSAGLGSVIFGLAPGISLAFFGRVLVGLGVSVVFISILKVQSRWFKESEFGTMSGITSFVGNMGGMLAQTPLALLVAAITWRNSFVVIGIFSVVVAALCFILVRNTPEDMKLPSIEEIDGKKAAVKESGRKPALLKGLAKVVANPRTWPGFVLFAAFFGAFIALTGTWGISFMVDVYGISKVSAANYMMAPVLGLAVGSIVLGNFSDRIKKRKMPMILFGAVYTACWGIIVLSGAKPPAGILIPLLFILGFSCSTFVLGWGCSKDVNPPEFSGIAMSVVNIGGFLGAAVLPPVLGKVFDSAAATMPAQQLYEHAFMYCFIVVVVGFLSAFLIKETNCRNIYRD